MTTGAKQGKFATEAVPTASIKLCWVRIWCSLLNCNYDRAPGSSGVLGETKDIRHANILSASTSFVQLQQHNQKLRIFRVVRYTKFGGGPGTYPYFFSLLVVYCSSYNCERPCWPVSVSVLSVFHLNCFHLSFSHSLLNRCSSSSVISGSW